MERMNSTSYFTQEEPTPFYGTMSSGKTFYTNERDSAARYHRDLEMNPVVEMRAFLAKQPDICRVQRHDSLENAGKMKSENNRLEVENNELKLCVQQSKEEMEIMGKRFYDLKKTLAEFDECVSQVNAERNQMFTGVYRTPNSVNILNDIMATSNTKLNNIVETFVCNLRQQLSATFQVNAGQACSFKEPKHQLKSDESEYKISRFNEQLKLYTQENKQNLHFSKLQRRAGHQDRDPSILLNQVENLKMELESAKNKAWGAENELEHARVYADERHQMAKTAEIKLSRYENEIFHLQSAFKDFRKWKTLIRARKGQTDALASVIDQLEMRIMNLTDVCEEMTTAYPPKPYKTIPEWSQLELDFNELSKKYTEAEREIQKLKSIMRDSPSQEECSSYKETIQELRNEVSQLKDERSRCNKKIASLHRNIERVEREKISVERDCGELERKNQDLLVLMNSLKENYESQKEELESVRGSQTTVEHEEMKHKAQQLELLVNSLKDQFEKLKGFHKQSELKQQQEIKWLSDELEKAQSAERVYQTKLTQATAEVEEMRHKAQQLELVVNSLKDQFEKLKQSHLQDKLKQQQEIKRLSDELEEAQSASRVYQTKLTQAKTDLEEMRENHERTLAHLKFNSQQETEKYISKISQLEEKTEELLNELGNAKKCQDFESDKEFMQTQQSLKVDLRICQKSQQRLLEEKEKKDKECEELRNQIQQLRAKNHKSDSSRSPRVKKTGNSPKFMSPKKTSPKYHPGMVKNFGLSPQEAALHQAASAKEMCFVGTDDEVREEMRSSRSEFEQENSEHLRLTDADKKGDLSLSGSDYEPTFSEGETDKELRSSSSDYEQEESSADQTSPKETKCLETPGKRRGEVKKMDKYLKKTKKETGFISPGKMSPKCQTGIVENINLPLQGLDKQDADLIERFAITDDECSLFEDGNKESHSSDSDFELKQDSEHVTDAEYSYASLSNDECKKSFSEGKKVKNYGLRALRLKVKNIFFDQTSPKERKSLKTPNNHSGEVKKMDRSPKSIKKEEGFRKRSSKQQSVKLERDGSEKLHSSASRPQPKPTESAPQPVRGEPTEQRTVPHKVLLSVSGKPTLPPLSGNTTFPPLSGKSLLPSIPRKSPLPSTPSRPTSPF